MALFGFFAGLAYANYVELATTPPGHSLTNPKPPNGAVACMPNLGYTALHTWRNGTQASTITATTPAVPGPFWALKTGPTDPIDTPGTYDTEQTTRDDSTTHKTTPATGRAA